MGGVSHLGLGFRGLGLVLGFMFGFSSWGLVGGVSHLGFMFGFSSRFHVWV